MCGITGYWNLRSGRPADEALIRHMNATLVHRGPDEAGIWTDGSLALGMRRLSVIDIAGGSQPMSDATGSVLCVFNGEIYNHRELRRELEALGHGFRTQSDTEVIVEAYRAWGRGCLERFNGMFGLALWDGARRELLLARDRLGIKPLYLWEGPGGIVFGSELKAVVSCPWVPVEFDLESVDDFMTYEYVPAPRSIVRDVKKLRPAEWFVFSESAPERAETGRFWELNSTALAVPGSPDDAARQLREGLERSVHRRLIADVPLGAFLSGGIDSSAIVGLMRQSRDGRDVKTFSLGFADPSYDERHFARSVAEHFGTQHVDAEVTPDIVQLAEQIGAQFDEPFADVSAFPTYLLSKLTREKVTVALSGDGGDELFAGYDHYRADRWASRVAWFARRRGWSMVDRLFDALPPAPQKKGVTNKAKRFVEGLRRPDDLEHARWFVFWDLDERRELYAPELHDALAGRDCFAFYRERLREGADRGFDGLQRQLYADVTGYLPDDILTKVDRMSMAVSLEARVPFLDHEFVELAMGIPAEWKLRGSSTKWILREATRDLLPPVVLTRGKEGFSIPLKNWIRGPLQPLLRDMMEGVRQRGWFAAEELDRLVDEHVRGRANHAHRLWCLMSLELSLRGLTAAGAARPSHAAGEDP